MPHNEEIESRILQTISRWKKCDAKKMFGGVCHLLAGNMFCGVHKDYLILRLGESVANAALKEPHVKPFDITGRPMKGWVMVSEAGFKTEADLRVWLGKARDFVKTLPPK